jgi:hypothetical protein
VKKVQVRWKIRHEVGSWLLLDRAHSFGRLGRAIVNPLCRNKQNAGHTAQFSLRWKEQNQRERNEVRMGCSCHVRVGLAGLWTTDLHLSPESRTNARRWRMCRTDGTNPAETDEFQSNSIRMCTHRCQVLGGECAKPTSQGMRAYRTLKRQNLQALPRNQCGECVPGTAGVDDPLRACRINEYCSDEGRCVSLSQHPLMGAPCPFEQGISSMVLLSFCISTHCPFAIGGPSALGWCGPGLRCINHACVACMEGVTDPTDGKMCVLGQWYN